MAELGQISNVYDDQPYQDFANLSNFQSSQSLLSGDQAARYADPFMGERSYYQGLLKNLISNPGSQESSPFYKYLMDTQLKAVNASNAARGLTRSGRGAMALQDRAAGVATQSYFPQVAALTQLAQGGSSPAAAALAYQHGVSTSQDQRQAAAASRAIGQQRPPQTPNYIPAGTTSTNYGSSNTNYGLPTGGTDPYAAIDAYNRQTQSNVNDILSGKYDSYLIQKYGIGQPSQQTSNYSTQYDPSTDPYWSSGGDNYITGGFDPYSYDFGSSDSPSYDNYGSSDFGYGEY